MCEEVGKESGFEGVGMRDGLRRWGMRVVMRV